jgi:hypothetical protein
LTATSALVALAQIVLSHVAIQQRQRQSTEREMTFDDMIDQAWDDHAEHAHAVADRLAAAAPTIAAQAHFAPFAGIVTHVYGEHLGECERGVALLTSLRKLPAFTDTPRSAAS